LTALDVEDLKQIPEGIAVEIGHSKTDQRGEGRVALVRFGQNPNLCPVRAVEAWREAAGVHSGPLFLSLDARGIFLGGRMSDKAVARTVKAAVELVGLNPRVFSGHSGRAGYVTEAKARGAENGAVMAQTGHKTPRMVQIYSRHTAKERWEKTPDLGL
jgi:integrase